MVIKIINAVLIFCLFLLSMPFAPAQTRNTYQADLLISEGKTVKIQKVEISLDADAVKISGKKKSAAAKIIPLTSIESVDYTYSDRPRYTAATLSTIAFGIIALPLFASRTKKNWLAINAGADSAILQLKSDNYRMLLLEMQNREIKISDSGNRDKSEKKQHQ